MDYSNKLAKLERLRELATKKRSPRTTDERRAFRAELVQTYSEVAELFREALKSQKIRIPGDASGTEYSDCFEAGFLSGTSFYERRGLDDLDRVIGFVKGRMDLPSTVSRPKGKRVFLAHGHDNETLNLVVRFLQRIGLEPIVLADLPNRGLTIIEKFEQYSDVGFAIALLTGDDRGGPVANPCDSYRPRARQNVIFELGFFIAKLARQNVCALYREGVEIPSNYSGVAFVSLDDSHNPWQLQLAQEMSAADLPVEMSKTET